MLNSNFASPWGSLLSGMSPAKAADVPAYASRATSSRILAPPNFAAE